MFYIACLDNDQSGLIKETSSLGSSYVFKTGHCLGAMSAVFYVSKKPLSRDIFDVWRPLAILFVIMNLSTSQAKAAINSLYLVVILLFGYLFWGS